MRRECVDCEWCKPLEDSEGEMIYFCMDTDGGNYCGITGLCGYCGEELVAWIYPFHIQKFAKMCGNYLDTGEKVVLLEDGIVAVDLVPICEYFGIVPERICEREE